MKIRKGFVSNSSTTSFCIYGVGMETGELKEKFKKEVYELTDLFEKEGLEVNFSVDCDYMYIGIEHSNIKDEETGKQFKTRIEDKLKKLLNQDDIKCSTYSEAYRDG